MIILDKLRSGRSWLAAVIAMVLTILAIIGARDLHVDANVVAALEGNSQGYLDYRAFQERFSLGEGDEALLVRASDLADGQAFDALESLILDLQFTDGVSEVVSLFSIPAPEATTPLILAEPETGLEARFDRLLAEAEMATALVSEDRGATLIHVVAVKDLPIGALFEAIGPVIESAAPLEVSAVGQAAVERQISDNLIRDQAVVTPLAVLVCILIGGLILRSIRAVIACALPAICGVMWFTGILGWVGQPLDPWLATLPTLVMVLAFADTLHLIYGMRDLPGGLAEAMRQILPAAFMTSLTSALALGSFAFTESDALHGLALWGPISMACGFAAVALIFPVAAHWLVRPGTARPAGFSGPVGIARSLLGRHRLMLIATLSVFIALMPMVNQTEPSFSVSEHIRGSTDLGRDIDFIEDLGLGSASLYLEIDDMDGEPGLSEADRRHIANVAQIALGSGSRASAASVIPERFVSEDQRAVALPVLLPIATDPDTFGAALERIETALNDAGLSDQARLAGQSLLAHEVVPETVAAMRISFLIALAAIALVVAVSLRSLPLALIATSISALPMLGIEAFLVLTGQSMTMSAAFALTVAFGIAVDDTIHYINRWQRSEGDLPERLSAALAHAAPPMVATTVLMSLGFLTTFVSATASLPAFGVFVIISLWIALIVDLLFLPALIRTARLR